MRTSDIFVKQTSIPEESPKTFAEPSTSDSITILLLGYGGAGHDGGSLSDVIMVAHINPKEKKVSLISIPRDLWVEIPIRSDISQSFKINHAYAIGLNDRNYPLKEPKYKGEGGGGVMTKEVIGEITGLRIDYFIAMDFDGFKKIIDALGGVQVGVPVTFDDNYYPIKGRENDTCGKSADEIAELHQKYSDTELHHQFDCRYEHIHFDKGSAEMTGEEALKFVRSRASAQHGGDFARSERQQALLLGLKDKFISLNALKNLDKLFNQFVGMVRTDLNLETTKKVIEMNGKPEDYKVSFINLTDQNVLVATKSFDGQFILIPKEGEGVYNGLQNFIGSELTKTSDH